MCIRDRFYTTACCESITELEDETGKKARMPEITDIAALRSAEGTYGWFATQFLPAVVGSRCWNANYRKKTLSLFVSISDEAFALVSFENNYERWSDMFQQKNTKSSRVAALWTNSGASLKDGQSKRFRGWAIAGIEKYNSYYDAIKKDRDQNPDFEVNLLRQFQESGNAENDTRVIYSNEGLRGPGPAHDLPWASDEAELGVTTDSDSEDD